MKWFKALALTLVVFLCFTGTSEARVRYRHHAAHPTANLFQPDSNIMFPWFGASVTQKAARPVIRAQQHVRKRALYASLPAFKRTRQAVSPATGPARYAAHTGTEIVPNPPGCPRTLFCGCGAAWKIFGQPLRELAYAGRKLNLWWAPDWMIFPKAAPAPQMVAVSSHHIFVLLEDRGNGNWLTYDANSGGNATRIHVRSIAGYSIHNPLVAKSASTVHETGKVASRAQALEKLPRDDISGPLQRYVQHSKGYHSEGYSRKNGSWYDVGPPAASGRYLWSVQAG